MKIRQGNAVQSFGSTISTRPRGRGVSEGGKWKKVEEEREGKGAEVSVKRPKGRGISEVTGRLEKMEIEGDGRRER